MPTASNVIDLLLDHGIRLKSIRPGRNEHILCPRCEGGSSREKSLSVTIDADGQGATWICHRGSCGWVDGARVHDEPVRSRPAKPVAEHTEAQKTNRPDWLYQWFADRNIGARVVNEFGIYAAKRWFNEDLREVDAIVFPYVLGGEVVNRKYRPRQQKQPQAQEKDALQTLFNADAVTQFEEIIWVEGEPDVMALAECGIKNAVSLKDGAPSKVNSANDKRFEAMRTHEEALGKVKRFILAGDMDTPGLALREELARRLGRHRCWIVNWPTGCKDAGDVLIKLGPDALLEAIKAAEPYPIEGIRKLQRGSLRKFRGLPPPVTMSTGTNSTDQVLKLPTEGRVIIVTGYPNHGKTTWLRFVMVHTAARHGRRWAVFSPENQPWERFMIDCARTYARKPFYPIKGIEACMSDADIDEAEAFLADRVSMIVCDAEKDRPTADWIFERGAAAVLRDGVTDLLIDPFNEIDQQRGNMSETDYIGLFLQRSRAFGQRYGCNVWIAAHPAKPPPLRPKEKRVAPGPYEINGSSHWANKADVGITIHNPEGTLTELHLWKARFPEWGRRGTMGEMDFDPIGHSYSTWSKETESTGQPGLPEWVNP